VNTPAQEDRRIISAERKKEEVKTYLAEDNIDEDADHLQYWRLKSTTYPALSTLARKYLCVPASSVYSERLFSEYGNLYEKKRSRIRPDCAEQVLFLHHNWRRVENNGRKPVAVVGARRNADANAAGVEESAVIDLIDDEDYDEDNNDVMDVDEEAVDSDSD
jgi:hypothetical protein